MKRIFIALAVLMLASVTTIAQQKPHSETKKQEVQLGRGMSLIAPGLIQIGEETNFFLQLADQIRLTEKQRATLEEIVYEFQRYSIQRMADVNVGDAELERLLTRDSIDLDAVRAKIKEIEAVTADVKIRKIESILKAVNTLTHEQHLKIVTVYLEPPAPKIRPQTERISE